MPATTYVFFEPWNKNFFIAIAEAYGRAIVKNIEKELIIEEYRGK